MVGDVHIADGGQAVRHSFIADVPSEFAKSKLAMLRPEKAAGEGWFLLYVDLYAAPTRRASAPNTSPSTVPSLGLDTEWRWASGCVLGTLACRDWLRARTLLALRCVGIQLL